MLHKLEISSLYNINERLILCGLHHQLKKWDLALKLLCM